MINLLKNNYRMKYFKQYKHFLNESLKGLEKAKKTKEIYDEVAKLTDNEEFIIYFVNQIKNGLINVNKQKMLDRIPTNIEQQTANLPINDFIIFLNDITKKYKIDLSNIISDLNNIISYFSTGILTNIRTGNIIRGYCSLKEDVIRTIIDYWTSPLSPIVINNQTISFKTPLDEMYKIAEDWHKSLKASGKSLNEQGRKFITFPDNYYWIDLEKNQCDDEANAMGHCGTTSSNETLFSLRKNQEPHVTVAYNKDIKNISQIKGKQNTKPVEKYHPYIVELLLNKDYPIDYIKSSYLPETDFSPFDLKEDLLSKVLKGNNILSDSIFNKDTFSLTDLTDTIIRCIKDNNIVLPPQKHKLTNLKLLVEGIICSKDIYKERHMFSDIEIVNDKPVFKLHIDDIKLLHTKPRFTTYTEFLDTFNNLGNITKTNILNGDKKTINLIKRRFGKFTLHNNILSFIDFPYEDLFDFLLKYFKFDEYGYVDEFKILVSSFYLKNLL